MLGERPVPAALQDLQDGLLDKAVQHGRDAQRAHPAARLGDVHPPHRCRFVGPVQQLFPDGWPVLFEVSRKFTDGPAVGAGTPPVLPDPLQCLLQVVARAHLLHRPCGGCQAFGVTVRRGRFGPFQVGYRRGFTPAPRPEGQFTLDVRPRVVHESRVLLALRPFGPSVGHSRPGEPRPFLPFRVSVPLEWSDVLDLLCPLLTSASRSGDLAAPLSPSTEHDADLPR